MKKDEVLKMAAQITAGMCANPTLAYSTYGSLSDSWTRQNLLQSVVQEVTNAANYLGIIIED